MIEDFIKLVPSRMLERSGSVFASGRKAFERPSDVYLLTGHPGGHPGEELQTVGSQIDMVTNQVSEEWSNFRDSSWGKHQAGQHTTQKSLQHLFDGLGWNPGDVPASTLVFQRAPSNEALEDKNGLAEACWPFHQAVIEELGVKVIVCVGKGFPGQWVCRKLGCGREPIDRFRDTQGKTSLTYEAPLGLRVVTLIYPIRGIDYSKSGDGYSNLVSRALE